MNFNLKPDTKETVLALSLSGIIIVSFYLIISNINRLAGVFGVIFHALLPFIFGIIIAFILTPLRNLTENKLLKKYNLSQKTKRKIGVAVSIIAMLFIIVSFFWLLIPQMASSIATFIGNLSDYISNGQKLLEQINGGDNELSDVLVNALYSGADALAKWMTTASGGLSSIVGYVGDIVSNIANFLIGIIIALYLLLDSEKFTLQLRKVTYSVLPVNFARWLSSVCRLTTDMFYKFISGKAIDSLIIGVICYIGCKILNMPYAVLIAVIIGVTNMIPVFGPFIGAIPCLLILVMIDPIKSLEFLIFIVVLQQCDGNIIGPYILGDAVGLPTFWVMFAIIVGGALFGVVGMFIGVPSFAVIYTLLKRDVENRLKEKNLTFKE